MATNYRLSEDQVEWDEIVTSSDEYSFLQSWGFGELQKELGNQVLRVVFEKEGFRIAAQLIIVAAKRGRIMQLRHAPLFFWNKKENLEPAQKKVIFNEFLKEIKNIAVKYRVDFLRLQPLIKTDSADTDLFKNSNFKSANIHNIDAEKTLILNLEKSEEEILTNMRKQTRYLIRKAGKDGVTVSENTDPKAVDVFFAIHRDTTERQKFKSYSQNYYQKFWKAVNSKSTGGKLSGRILTAEYNGKAIASAIIVFYGNKAFYSDGGSLTEFNKIPASYAIQWKAIQIAKSLGLTTYNFWGGVSPDQENANYPWYGIDLFKRGFGGERIDYMHALDLPLGAKYYLTSLWEWVEKKRRGY